MSESEVPVPPFFQMTPEERIAFINSVPIKAPSVVFDEEQYERDVRDGLIPVSRFINNSPYLASDLKASPWHN